MKLLGDTQHTVVTARGIYSIRVEGFQDDRFRLMFVCRSGDRDVRWIPMKFRKGTNNVDLTKVWPEIEKELTHA